MISDWCVWIPIRQVVNVITVVGVGDAGRELWLTKAFDSVQCGMLYLDGNGVATEQFGTDTSRSGRSAQERQGNNKEKLSQGLYSTLN